MKKEEKKVKYGFGISDTQCFGDEFDTLEELIAFAQDAHDNPDGNYWDEDWDEDQYTHCINVGTIENITPMDFAPTLDDIADQMTDSFYCRHNIDDDAEIKFHPTKEAEEAYKAFIEKYCDMPCQFVCQWTVGVYDLKEHKWVERYGIKEGEK